MQIDTKLFVADYQIQNCLLLTGSISLIYNQLDNVSAGLTEWKGLLKDYWTRFSTYCTRAGSVHIHQVSCFFTCFKDFGMRVLTFDERVCFSVRSCICTCRWKKCWRKHLQSPCLPLSLIKVEHAQGISFCRNIILRKLRFVYEEICLLSRKRCGYFMKNPKGSYAEGHINEPWSSRVP